MSDENNIAATPETTEENSEILALEARICEEENNIKVAVHDLGDAYARKYSANFDPEFAPFFNRIFSAQNNIGGILAEIRNLKGLLLCPNCRHEFPKDAPSCHICGCPNPEYVPPTPAAAEAQPAVCAVCGVPILEGNIFCTNCGNRVAPLDEPMPAPATISCKNCGAELRDSAAFCTRCGTKVEAEVPKENICPNCGTKLQGDDAFCVNCGTKL